MAQFPTGFEGLFAEPSSVAETSAQVDAAKAFGTMFPDDPVSASGKIWRRGDCVTLAHYHCARCHGSGVKRTVLLSKRDRVCACVYRRVFRECAVRYEDNAARQMNLGACSTWNGRFYERKCEDFRADFVSVCRTALKRHATKQMSNVDAPMKVFEVYLLAGLDVDLGAEMTWRPACRKLKIDKGTFFHALYRAMEICGRALREAEPFALHPCDAYFGAMRPANKVEARLFELAADTAARARRAA